MAQAEDAPPHYESLIQEGALPAPRPTQYQWTDMQFLMGTDLIEASRQEALLLASIERNGHLLYDESVINNAIKRYETCWLPLQSEIQRLTLIPPLDVYWVWHCHMLCPLAYRRDCEAIVGKVIDHRHLNDDQRLKYLTESEKVWQRQFPNEAYDLRIASQTAASSCSQSYSKKSSYDIAAACQRQRDFNYQISLPHYKDTQFLTTAFQRYQKYIYLKHLYPREFLVPCYDFDLVWHSHQHHPLAYSTDTEKYVGRLLNHDDTAGDRNVGSIQNNGEKLTRSLWIKHFPDAPFWHAGCMYRGHTAPSLLGFFEDNQNDMNPYPASGFISISNVTFHGCWNGATNSSDELDFLGVPRNHVKVKIFFGKKFIGKSSSSGVNITLQRDENRWFLPAPLPSGNFKTLSISGSMRNQDSLQVSFIAYRQSFRTITDEIHIHGQVRLADIIPTLLQNGWKEVEVKLQDSNGLTGAVTFIASYTSRAKFDLSHISNFVKDEIREESTWEHYIWKTGAMLKSAAKVGATVQNAQHKLTDSNTGQQLTVNVVHSAQMLLSMIYAVNSQGKVVALSHLVSPDVLPQKLQLLNANLPNLSQPGDRAMVIMNSAGDYSVIVGRWVGYAKCTPRVGRTRGKPGSPGSLSTELYKYHGPTGKLLRESNSSPDMYSKMIMKFSDLEAKKSEESIRINSSHPVEAVVTAFSIANLMVLCNPDKTRDPGSRKVGKCLPFHKWPLMKAVGYGQEVPSNRYLAALARQNQSSSNNSHLYYDPFWYPYYPWIFMYGAACGACGGIIGGACGASCGGAGACGGGMGGCGACGAACGSDGAGCGGGCGSGGGDGGGCGGSGCGGGGCGSGCGGCGGD